MTNIPTISVSLLDKEYQVACPPQEQEALLRAGRQLDKRLREVRDAGAIVGLERIAIMVALNLSYEIMQLTENSASNNLDLNQLQALSDRVDRLLHEHHG
jgi:cell division protein ZapA